MGDDENDGAEQGLRGRMLTYERYQGNSLSDGRGVYVYPNKSIYEGEFRVIKGQFYKHGRGFLQWGSGDYYAGYWENGLQSGLGVLVYSESDEDYSGEWVEGARVGVGSYRYADGSFYDGMWKANKRHGLGYHVIFVDKEEEEPAYYKGSFELDVRHGKGVLHYYEIVDKKEGRKIHRNMEGDWDYGELRKPQPTTLDESSLKIVIERARDAAVKAEKLADEIIAEFHNKLYLIGKREEEEDDDSEERALRRRLRRRRRRGEQFVGLTDLDIARVAAANAKMIEEYQQRRQRDIKLPPIAGGWRVEISIDPQGAMMEPRHHREGKRDKNIAEFLKTPQTGWRRFFLHVPQGTNNLRYVATFIEEPDGELLAMQLKVLETTLDRLHGGKDDIRKRVPQYRRGAVAGLEALPGKEREELQQRQRPKDRVKRVYVLGAKTSEKVYGDTVLEEMDDDQKEKRQEKMDSLRKKLHGARHHAIKELRLRRLKEAEGKDIFS